MDKRITILAALALAACSGKSAGPAYVEGVVNAEDLAALPGSRWIITSGLDAPGAPGRLSLIDRESRSVRVLFSADSPVIADAREGDPACPGPLQKGQFGAHGIALRETAPGKGTLYAVNHTGREAVELFALDWSGQTVTAAWAGCVPLPPGVLSNGVASLPDGRIAVTWMNAPEFFTGPAGRENAATWIPKFVAGETTGYAATWKAGEGWRKLPGSEGSVPNGIEASADGSQLFVAIWRASEVRRIDLASAQVARVKLDFMPDNLRLGDDGRLWTAGAVGEAGAYFACAAKPGCHNDFRVASIDPEAMTAELFAQPDTRPAFGDATAAVRVGDELWLGSNPARRVAVFAVRR